MVSPHNSKNPVSRLEDKLSPDGLRVLGETPIAIRTV